METLKKTEQIEKTEKIEKRRKNGKNNKKMKIYKINERKKIKSMNFYLIKIINGSIEFDIIMNTWFCKLEHIIRSNESFTTRSIKVRRALACVLIIDIFIDFIFKMK